MQFRPFRSHFAFVLTFLALLGASAVAEAAGEKDKEALKLHDSAMNDDYLAVEFGKAEKKLRDALKKCGATGCTPAVVGKLHISIGTVLGVGLNKMDAAKEAFKDALKADPNAALDKGLSTPELVTAFNEVKGGAAPPGPGPTPPPKKAGGDLTHTPVTEQVVNHPVPVYIDVPGDLGVTKVTLRYKPFGGTAWKSVELKKHGEGFGAEIPCADVSTTGDIRYYITASDAEGNPIATAGTLKSPHKVAIKNEIESEAPHLPNAKPGKACADKGTCPPGLPGCPDLPGGKRGDKGWGATCEQTQECQAGLACLNGSCEEDKNNPGGPGGPPTKAKMNLVSVGFQLDVLFLNTKESGVCSQDPGYSCFYQNGGSQFYGNPAEVEGLNGIQGGFGLAGGRVLLGYDRQFTRAIPAFLGIRLGYAFPGTPTSNEGPDPNGAAKEIPKARAFIPIHAELRAGYVFGGAAFEGGKFHPYVFLAGGFAEADAAVPVTVCDTLDQTTQKNLAPGVTKDCGPDNKKTGQTRTLDAYQITGLNFFGAGAGTTYGLTPNFGLSFEVKVMVMVPTSGIVIAPTLSPIFAF